MKKVFLFVPGAWMGSWIWKDLKQNLEKQNHKVYSITLSGLNSKNENKNFGLQDHVNDVKNFIHKQSLTNILLVGHSYSGFVIGQVADQIPNKISKLIFVEAFFPTNGENLLQTANLDLHEETNAIKKNNGKWPMPTPLELKYQPYLSTEHIDFLIKNLIDHPAKSVQDKANILSNKIAIPSVFVGGKIKLSKEQKSLYGKVDFYKLDGGHWPMLSELKKLTDILNNIAQKE